jgi:hypothetical protein
MKKKEFNKVTAVVFWIGLILFILSIIQLYEFIGKNKFQNSLEERLAINYLGDAFFAVSLMAIGSLIKNK